jgi:hypothetical protein
LILSAAVDEAISAPRDVLKIAGLKNTDGEELADTLEAAMEQRVRISLRRSPSWSATGSVNESPR